MAEKKSSSKKSSGRKSSAKKSSAKKGSGRKTTAAKKTSSSAPRKRAAKKGGQARGRQQKAQKQARTVASAATGEFSGKSVAEFRQALTTNLIRPLEMVMISRSRIEDALDEVVKRGRMTRDDATQLGQALFTLGRQQTDDVMKDLEQLLGRGRNRLEVRTGDVRDRSVEAARGARRSVGRAADAARTAADPLLVQADRARRVAGVGPTFPISGYDDLTAAQISTRLDTLTPAELRKVRDYERRRGNRKSVLEAIESNLS
jgi:polyhydroxyalkanoate synthesis regulator phasin